MIPAAWIEATNHNSNQLTMPHLSQIQTMIIMHTGTAVCFVPHPELPRGQYQFEYIQDGTERFYRVFSGIIDVIISIATFVACFSILTISIHH